MAILVVDCSVTMSWLFREEFTQFSERVLDEVIVGQAVEPMIWPLEVANVMLSAERRGRLTQAESAHFLSRLSELSIDVSTMGQQQVADELVALARETGTTVYDASYLELAARLGVPLATLDRRLAEAATKIGVALYS
jgi:predicted nucleic acid-binding protein